MLVEAPTYDRPLKILTRLGADIVGLPMDDDGPAARRARAGARGRREARLPLHDRDVPEPERAHALRGAPQAHRRARARARAARARGRPVRARALRGRGAADDLRAGGRHERRLRVLVLEDDRTGRSRRLLRPAAGARRADRGARSLDVHLAAVHDAGDRARVPAARELRAEPRARARACSRRGATRCSTRSSGTCPTARPGAGPKAATSSGSTCRPRPATCSHAPRRPASRSCKGTDFFADGGGTKSLRLAFSFVSPEEITDGIEKLAGLLRGAPSPASAL